MELIALAALTLFIFAYSLISFPAQRSIISPPMIFLLFGVLLGPHALGLFTPDFANLSTKLLLGAALILILFSDGCRVQIPGTSRFEFTTFRLLFVGMSISIVLGAVTALFLFESLGFWEGAVLAALLIPTDLALGQAALSDGKIPTNVRNNLYLESALNNGLIIPMLLILILCQNLNASAHQGGLWLLYVAREIGVGALTGVAIGLLGEWLLTMSQNRKAINASFQQLLALALALLTFSTAEIIGGNGFIAVYLVGFTLGNARGGSHGPFLQFSFYQSEYFTLFSYLLFGAIWLVPALQSATWQTFLYVGLSLSVFRMVSVFMSLYGGGMPLRSKFFISWMGPRGMTSLLIAFFALEKFSVPYREEIFSITSVVVFFSIILHGLTAKPLLTWFCKKPSLEKKAKANL
jgi:sodium/hydrogen antiporter